MAVTPNAAPVAIDGKLGLTATARNSAGEIVLSAGTSWLSLDTTVATVTSTGSVTGRAEGSVLIVAKNGVAADTAEITVPPIIHLGVPSNQQVFAMGTGATELIVGELGPPTAPRVPFVMGLDRRVVNLPLFAGATSGVAAAVSDVGIIVGTTGGAVVWTRGSSGVWNVDGLPWTEGSSLGLAVSPDGMFAAGAVGISSRSYPARWSREPGGSWSVERLPVPIDMFGMARDVNDAGDVVGAYYPLQLTNQAVLWRKDVNGWQIEKLGDQGDDGTGAYAINAFGVVVGRNSGVPVTWTKSSGTWSEKRLTIAGAQGGFGWASAINDAGIAAGTITVGETQHAFRWSEGTGGKLLQSLAGAGSGWGINAAGDVVGVTYNAANLATTLTGTLWRNR